MEFERRKAAAMAAMASPAPDKSPKGTVDAGVAPLLAAINACPLYFTTSSCAGRISVLAHRSRSPQAAGASGGGNSYGEKERGKKKAGGGGWVFVSHDPADPETLVGILFAGRREVEGEGGGEVVFRFEPLIVAVECRDVAAAQALVSTAISCGFRESGITSSRKRIMIAIRCSVRLEVPLGQIGQIVVPPEYVRYLVKIANEKMGENRKRTDGLLHVLQSKGLPGFTKEMFDSNEKDCDEVVDKECLLHIEAGQSDVSLETRFCENSVVKSHNEDNILAFSRDRCGFKYGVYSGEDKDTTASCEKESNPLNEAELGCCHKELIETNLNLGKQKCCLSVVIIKIVGEPIEKLFLWGQSACTLDCRGEKYIIVFGGFGGLGRHARRNYSLILDSQSGLLKEIDVVGRPSPRLGHTSSVVGHKIYVIGGRDGPSEILNDVWALDTSQNRWALLDCSGSLFGPRHRHAAAVVGSNIYVFGGLNNEMIHSTMNVLNVDTLQWSEVNIQGEWPCARHSHSLVANGHQLFMFGGYDGEKALGDLYTFDVRTSQWKKEKTTGRSPSPRFSHSMFVYEHYLGIIGGCPVRQQYQKLALLNLHHYVWVHVTVDSLDRDLWVRSSTCVIDGDLFIVGGGASCYAFGTKFNQPMKINLRVLDSVYELLSDKEESSVVQCCEANNGRSSLRSKHLQGSLDGSDVNTKVDMPAEEDADCMYTKNFVLQLERKYAKLAKDILKKFRWLDLNRKVWPSNDGCFIHFPISRNFYDLFQKEQLNSIVDDLNQLGAFLKKGLSKNEVSFQSALNFLQSSGGSLLIDDVACSRKIYRSPQKIMKESVYSLLRENGMPLQLLEQLPTRWEQLGDIVVLPKTSFKDRTWDSISEELWPIVAKSLGARRLARQGQVLPTGTRDSTLEVLVGDNGWVVHQENGILYSFDATKCMFSSGNLSEKLRMAHLDCRYEIIVDLFAGIGYFVLPFLVKAKAKLVYACEWNPHALMALRQNISANSVEDRCVILEGDNRVTAPKGVADRVCLGLLPSSECSWTTAVRALRAEGGLLHIHGNVNDSEESSWLEYVVKSISSIAETEGLSWNVSIQHVERVKWYGPHIRHVVADVRCKKP